VLKTTILFLIALPVMRAQSGLAGEWKFAVIEFGRPNYSRVSVKSEDGKLTAQVMGRAVEFIVTGREIVLKAEGASGKGVIEGGKMSGEVTLGSRTVAWTAERIPPRPAQPRTHDFTPTQFELYFSPAPKPVLHIHPGDTVRTWSVDAGGVDPQGQRRSQGGNPQTGPFYVEGAIPGDTLVIRLNRVRLNRDWAGSGNQIMRNALDPWSIADLKWQPGVPGRWKLDREKGIAFLEKPSDKLKNFSVPLAPMLGCVGVAPQGDSSIRTTDSGRFGGNMDYNQIREGTTVYLPVYHPGALLFLGDGHAAQGDGELTGDALETSMDFEFTVDVLPVRSLGHPLAENSEYMISIGISGSLQDALQMATSGLMRWLDREYKLTPSEAAMVLGFAIRYDVVDLVGTQVSIAAKVPKSALAKLAK